MKKAVKVVGCVATGLAVAGVGYFVGKYLKPEHLEELEDEFLDDDEMDADLDDDLKEVDSEEAGISEDAGDFREDISNDCSPENN